MFKLNNLIIIYSSDMDLRGIKKGMITSQKIPFVLIYALQLFIQDNGILGEDGCMVEIKGY